MIYSERIMCWFLKLIYFERKNILKIERHFFRARPQPRAAVRGDGKLSNWSAANCRSA
jgi:hypothetical protein